jgi:hypothetical protein
LVAFLNNRLNEKRDREKMKIVQRESKRKETQQNRGNKEIIREKENKRRN